MDRRSLTELCSLAVLEDPHLTQLGMKYLPSRLLTDIFLTGMREHDITSRSQRRSMEDILSQWPVDILDIDRYVEIEAVTGDAVFQCEDLVIDGLLCVQPDSKLTRVHTRSTPFQSVLLLPALHVLSLDIMSTHHIVASVKESWENFVADDVEDFSNLQSVLRWELDSLKREKHPKSTTQNIIEITCTCEFNLGDWIAMKEVILGLILQWKGPFRLHVAHLSVYNYSSESTNHLRWLLSLVQLEDITNLSIFGKRRRSDYIMFEMFRELQQMTNLKTFNLGYLKKKYMVALPSPTDPTKEDILQRTAVVVDKWRNLEIANFLGARLSGHLSIWLQAMKHPLKELHLTVCYLNRQDMEGLLCSRHIAAVEQLGLEGNCLRNMGQLMVQITSIAGKLEVLNLRETQLRLDELLELVLTLEQSDRLHTLALSQGDSWTEAEYIQVIEAACVIPRLTHLYLFPFDCGHLGDVRQNVLDQAVRILKRNGKQHTLGLHY